MARSKECVHGVPRARWCRQQCQHSNRCGQCGKCGDKPRAGERLKPCRCGRFIDESWTICGRCQAFENSIWNDAPREEHRDTMREVIYQLNDRPY